MKALKKRQIAAWVLLAVFLPAYILASLHVHQTVDISEEECYECEHHLPHLGHISSAKATIHDCLLCQLNRVPFVIPQTRITHNVQILPNALYIAPCQKTTAGVQGLIFPRAPPV